MGWSCSAHWRGSASSPPKKIKCVFISSEEQESTPDTNEGGVEVWGGECDHQSMWNPDIDFHLRREFVTYWCGLEIVIFCSQCTLGFCVPRDKLLLLRPWPIYLEYFYLHEISSFKVKYTHACNIKQSTNVLIIIFQLACLTTRPTIPLYIVWNPPPPTPHKVKGA